jgi:CoA:oxalate CoA-transferase
VAPIWSVKQALGSEQCVSRGFLSEVDDPVLPGLRLPSQPIKFSSFDQNKVTRAPRLGEHTDETLRELLGLAESKIAELRALGVFGGMPNI